MNKIYVSEIQRNFIKSAIDLKGWIVDFNLSNKDFIKNYGASKKSVLKELYNLLKSLKEVKK